MTVYSRWEVNNQSNKDVMTCINPQISRYLLKSSAIFMIQNLQKITAAGKKYRIHQQIWVNMKNLRIMPETLLNFFSKEKVFIDNS